MRIKFKKKKKAKKTRKQFFSQRA